MTEGQPGQGPRITVPSPDPTERTREELLRELGLLRGELTREIQHAREMASSRMDAMDAAAALRLDALGEVRPQTVRLIEAHSRLTDERFASVYRMFEERDVRATQEREASKEALAAALAAAKELVTAQAQAATMAADKGELSTNKQVDQIERRLDALRDEQNQRRETDREATDQRIQELKERIDRGEGATLGTAGSRVVFSQNVLLAIAVVGALLAVASLVLRLKGG